jgi:hypothetical protein
MRKSAKRGEPQIFLLCVTLWASAGGVVSARAFAVPVPNGIGRKQKRATLASTHWRGCWGLPFSTAKTRYMERGRKKAVTRPLTLACRTGLPPSRNEELGRGEDLSPSLSVRQPNDCCPRKRHVWGTRQSRWFRGPAALLCELSLFVLAVTSRKIDPISDVGASETSIGYFPYPKRVNGAAFFISSVFCTEMFFVAAQPFGQASADHASQPHVA